MSGKISARRFRDWSSFRSVLDFRAEKSVLALESFEEKLKDLLKYTLHHQELNQIFAPFITSSVEGLEKTSNKVNNLRGNSISQLSLSKEKKTPQEEVLCIKGKISHLPLSIGREHSDIELAKTLDETGELQSKDQQEITSFEVKILSSFSHFEARKTIVHSLHCYLSDILRIVKPNFNLQDLLEDSAVSIEEVSLGLEFFQSRIVFSIFGLVPIVNEKIHFVINREKLSIGWERSSGMSQTPLKIKKTDKINIISHLIEDLDFWDNFEQEIVNKIAV